METPTSRPPSAEAHGPPSPPKRQGWSLAGSGCLGLLLGLVLGIAGLTFVFYSLGWEVKGEDPAANAVLTLAITTPQAFLIGVVGMLLAMTLRKEGAMSLLPVLTTAVISCGIFWLGSELLEARQMALQQEVDVAVSENGFFITKQLAKQLSWKTFFLVFIMIFTAIIDLVLLPFAVLFDPDVLREGFVLLLIFLGLTGAGAVVSGVLWWPWIFKKR